MELWLPEQVALDPTSLELISDVEKTARRVNDFRPLPTDVVQRIDNTLLGDRVYNSNAIEGNTLEYRETVMILEQGIGSGGRRREALEARNLGQAARMITAWKDDGDTCHTATRFLEVQKALMREIDDQWAGRFREHRVMIQGATLQPPPHDIVPSLVERVMEKLSADGGENPVLLATWAHWAIARIHPFHDGNGRMARLWQDLVLLQAGLTCGIIRPADRRNYLDALAEADGGDFNPLVQLIAQRVAATFEKYLAEIRQTETLKGFVRELAGEGDERIRQARELDYTRWARKMEQLRSEFELCAGKLSEESEEFKLQIRPYELIDRETWLNILQGAKTNMTWFFEIHARSHGTTYWRYIFFPGKHFWLDELDDPHTRARDRVNLLVSESEGLSRAKRPEEPGDSPITLREIFVVDDKLVRRRFDQSSNTLVDDVDIAPLQVAMDFFKEVVLHRLR